VRPVEEHAVAWMRRREARRDRHGKRLGDVLGIHFRQDSVDSAMRQPAGAETKGIELVRFIRAGSFDRDAYFAPRAPHA